MRTVGIPRPLWNILTTGMVPPDRKKTGAVPKPFSYASVAARIAGCPRLASAGLAADTARTRERTVGGVRRAMCSRKEPLNLLRFLIGRKSEAELGQGAGRNHALATRTLISAHDPVHRQSRPDGCALIQRVATLTPTSGCPGIFKDLLIRRPNARHVIALRFAPPADAVVESRYRDLSVRIMQPSDDFTQHLEGVVNCPAVNPRSAGPVVVRGPRGT